MVDLLARTRRSSFDDESRRVPSALRSKTREIVGEERRRGAAQCRESRRVSRGVTVGPASVEGRIGVERWVACEAVMPRHPCRGHVASDALESFAQRRSPAGAASRDDVFSQA
jgi:hypothetical protein